MLGNVFVLCSNRSYLGGEDRLAWGGRGVTVPRRCQGVPRRSVRGRQQLIKPKQCEPTASQRVLAGVAAARSQFSPQSPVSCLGTAVVGSVHRAAVLCGRAISRSARWAVCRASPRVCWRWHASVSVSWCESAPSLQTTVHPAAPQQTVIVLDPPGWLSTMYAAATREIQG